MLNAVELIADRRGLRPTRMTTPELRSHLAISAVLPVIFLASIPVAYLVKPKVAQWSWVLIAVLIPVVRRIARPRTTASASNSASTTQENPE